VVECVKNGLVNSATYLLALPVHWHLMAISLHPFLLSSRWWWL